MEFEFLSKVEQWIPSDFLFLITHEEKMLSLPGPPARDAKGLDTDFSAEIMSHSHQRKQRRAPRRANDGEEIV